MSDDDWHEWKDGKWDNRYDGVKKHSRNNQPYNRDSIDEGTVYRWHDNTVNRKKKNSIGRKRIPKKTKRAIIIICSILSVITLGSLFSPDWHSLLDTIQKNDYVDMVKKSFETPKDNSHADTPQSKTVPCSHKSITGSCLDNESKEPDVQTTNNSNSNTPQGALTSKQNTKYTCTKVSEQETKCALVYASTPSDTKSESGQLTKNELKKYALDLINKDRADFGKRPVVLGNNPLADEHARYLLDEKAIYHCRTTNNMGQNVAVEGYDYNIPPTGIYCSNNNYHMPVIKDRIPSVCKGAYVICDTINPTESIKNSEYNMMYDDAESNWGHKYNILDSMWGCVSLGIEYDKYFFVIVQDFQTYCSGYTKTNTLNKLNNVDV